MGGGWLLALQDSWNLLVVVVRCTRAFRDYMLLFEVVFSDAWNDQADV